MMWRSHTYRRNGMGNPSGTRSVESQIALDAAVARALQFVEEKLLATSPSGTTAAEAVLQETSYNPANDLSTSADSSDLATRQDDVDPDTMTYEELQALGEAIGTESRGLSEDAISLLPSSLYEASEDEDEECIICCMPYKNGEEFITLPCKHYYHSHCIRQWFKIKQACPVCNKDVS